jgi:DNA polymerase-4
MKKFGNPQKVEWLFLDMNSYFASVEQQLHPEFRGKPIAVIPVESESTCAIAASYEAKAYGISTGTPIYVARQRCPDLICVMAKHNAYVEYHHKILEEVNQYLPIHSVASIDEMSCKLGNNFQETDKAIQLAKDIKAGIARNIGKYIRCSIGLSSNRFLAKVATDMEKPDGLVVLDPNALPQAFESLTLSDLPGIGQNMLKRLYRNGVYTLEDLYNLSPKHMRSIWHNVGGERFWYALHGQEIPPTPTNRSTVGHSHVLDPEYRPPAKAEQVARRLLVKAATRLRRLEHYTRKMTVSIRIENGPRYALETKFDPCQDNHTLLHTLLMMWHQLLAQSKQGRIKKISITLHGLVKNPFNQYGLFDQKNIPSKNQERLQKASSAMDKLNEKFGRNTVVMGDLPDKKESFSGTKIAFSRIPDKQEFYE